MDDLHARALRAPLPPGGDTRPYVNRTRTPDGRVVTCCLTTEVCGCLGPVWHCSISTQRLGIEMCDDEHLAHLVAHKLLADVGQPGQELWWWNMERRVGHLRVPVTTGERLMMGPGMEELPDDHDEPGEWLDRKAPIARAG